MRQLWQTSKVKMGEERIKSMKKHKQNGGYFKYVHMFTRGRSVEKLIIRYVRTKWMAPEKYCGMFLVHWFGQVH